MLDVAIVCAIVFWWYEKMPFIDQMICPCAAFVGFLMHLGLTSHWSEWHFIVVKGSPEMCIC